MRNLVLLWLLIPMLVFGDAVIFQGSNVKALKPNLDLNGQSKIMSGTVDPTVTATSANKGSQYLNTSSGITYIKRDNGSSTNWDVAGNVENQEMVHQNMLSGKGAGFEYGVADWTASGGTLAAVTSGSNLLSGRGSATWDSSAASQTLKSALISIPKGLYGASGMIRCKSQTPSGVATHKFQVYDGTNVIGEQNLVSSTLPLNQTVNFIFPSSGSLQIQFTSVAADEPLIAVDDCYIGSATNLSEVSQAEFYGSQLIQGTTNCYFTGTNSSVFNTFAADADCPTPILKGYADTTVGKRPAVSFPSLPPGRYLVRAQATMDFSAADLSCGFRIEDTTHSIAGPSTRSQPVGSGGGGPGQRTAEAMFEYTTAQGATVFHVETNTSGGSGTCDVAVNVSNTDFYISVYRFPTSSQTVYSPEVYNWNVDANITGANPSLSTSNQSSYIEITDAGLTLTNNSMQNSLVASIPCSSTNPPTGTTCSAGSESIGVYFYVPVGGLVEACVEFSHYINVNATGYVGATFQIVETPSNSQTILQEGKSRANEMYAPAIAAAQYTPRRTCGTFNFSTAGYKTLRLMYEQFTNATVNGNQILADADASAGQRDIHWTVRPITQNVPAPVLFGGSEWLVESRITGASINLGTTSTSVAAVQDGALTMTNHTNALVAQIPCSSTNPSTGTTCSVGSEQFGAVWDLPNKGWAEICMKFNHQITGNSSQALASIFKIVETPNNAQTVIQEAYPIIYSGSATNSFSYNSSTPVNLCGSLYFSSAGQKTVRLLYQNQGAGTATGNSFSCEGGTDTRSCSITVKPITPNGPVTINVSALDYLETALTGDTFTTTANTYVDVSGSSISLTPGTWDIGFDGMVGFGRVSGGCVGNIAITDSSNTVIGNALRAFYNEGYAMYIPVNTVARNVTIASTTTYKLRVRSGFSSATCSAGVAGAANQFGALTDPDSTSVMWARRIK